MILLIIQLDPRGETLASGSKGGVGIFGAHIREGYSGAAYKMFVVKQLHRQDSVCLHRSSLHFFNDSHHILGKSFGLVFIIAINCLSIPKSGVNTGGFQGIKTPPRAKLVFKVKPHQQTILYISNFKFGLINFKMNINTMNINIDQKSQSFSLTEPFLESFYKAYF